MIIRLLLPTSNQGAFPWLWRWGGKSHHQSQGKVPWGRGCFFFILFIKIFSKKQSFVGICIKLFSLKNKKGMNCYEINRCLKAKLTKEFKKAP